jgi:hypothetical protein
MDQLKALMSSQSSEFEFRRIDFKHTVKALFCGKWSRASAFAFVPESSAMTKLMKTLRFKEGCLLRFGHVTGTPEGVSVASRPSALEGIDCRWSPETECMSERRTSGPIEKPVEIERSFYF